MRPGVADGMLEVVYVVGNAAGVRLFLNNSGEM